MLCSGSLRSTEEIGRWLFSARRSVFAQWVLWVAVARPSARSRREEVLEAKIKSSFQESDRTYGARRGGTTCWLPG